MTAFLYLPSRYDDRPIRRVDLANIGSLFADTEEPSTESVATVRMRRLAVALLLLLFAVGDTILVARPDVISTGFVQTSSMVSVART